VRITFVIRRLDVGGAERQLALLAAELARRGHAVTVVTLYPGGALEPQVRSAGVAVVSACKSGRWDLIGFFGRFYGACKSSRPEIVCGWMPFENIVSARPAGQATCSAHLVVRAASASTAQDDFPTRLLYRNCSGSDVATRPTIGVGGRPAATD
jgi:hypothetical protein